MGVVQNIVITNSKIENQIITYMFLGYAKNNIGSIYQMLSPECAATMTKLLKIMVNLHE